MYRIAIVEDQEHDAHRLAAALDRYAKEKHVPMEHTWIRSATEFLEDYHHQYEIIFMDIHMPGIDGMTAAHMLREKDHTVVLSFITSLAQYAVEGYSVEAIDFILKPISYAALELKFSRMLERCRLEEKEIIIKSGGSSTKLHPSEIHYVEIYDHHIQIQKHDGVMRIYGTLKEVENSLPEGFFRVNNQTIVNLRYVRQVDSTDASVDGRKFPISRGRRKEFLAALHGERLKD